MNAEQVRSFVMRYLEAAGCRILDASPAHVTVKLSPEADKALTNRPYYWGFVERTGAEPETMTIMFVFDPDRAPPPLPGPGAPRMPRETVAFGGRMLSRLFDVVRQCGRFVQLYEDLPARGRDRARMQTPLALGTLAVVNYKIEYVCDMKRDELVSLAIDLNSGRISENAMERLAGRRWTPKLPPDAYVAAPRLSLARALDELEAWLEARLRRSDNRWAAEAHERWLDETARVDAYYAELAAEAAKPRRPAEEANGLNDDGSGKDDAEGGREPLWDQYERRKAEIDRQYRPRIDVSAVNAGLFHPTAYDSD